MVEHVRLVFRLPDERAFDELRYFESEELHEEAVVQTSN